MRHGASWSAALAAAAHARNTAGTKWLKWFFSVCSWRSRVIGVVSVLYKCSRAKFPLEVIFSDIAAQQHAE
jgi:hypothetical protein